MTCSSLLSCPWIEECAWDDPTSNGRPIDEDHIDRAKQSFFGLWKGFRRFAPNIGGLLAPLNKKLRKGQL